MEEEHSFDEYTEVANHKIELMLHILYTYSCLVVSFPSDDYQRVMSLLFKASGGVSCSVKGDYQPPCKSPLLDGPSGLWRAETGAGQQSKKLCWNTSEEIGRQPPGAKSTVSHFSCNILWQNCPSVLKMFQFFSQSFFVCAHRICSEFEAIRENILKVPESTEDMTQIIDHIDFTKTKGIAELNEKIKVNNLKIGSTCCILH